MSQLSLIDHAAAGGATFSPDRRYRYLLWRPGTRPTLFLMLNPSTADETKDDPTIRRCRVYSRDWGFEGTIIANIFAWRSTDPKALYALEDPVGPENDRYILEAAERARGPIVCGWGNHGALHGRGQAVLDLLRRAGHVPMALRITGEGHPNHPLYLPADLRPKEIP